MPSFNRGNLKSAKLTPEQVYDIRQKYTEGWTQAALARLYQVTTGTIGRIVRGEAWQQFANPAADLIRGENPDEGPLSPADKSGAQRSLERFQALMRERGAPEPTIISEEEMFAQEAERKARLLERLQRGVVADPKYKAAKALSDWADSTKEDAEHKPPNVDD